MYLSRAIVSGTLEEAFRGFLFEYIYDPLRTVPFFWPHTDSGLFRQKIYLIACVCVRSSSIGVEANPISYNLPRTINFFLVAYRLLPFVTDHFGSCVVCVSGELE